MPKIVQIYEDYKGGKHNTLEEATIHDIMHLFDGNMGIARQIWSYKDDLRVILAEWDALATPSDPGTAVRIRAVENKR